MTDNTHILGNEQRKHCHCLASRVGTTVYASDPLRRKTDWDATQRAVEAMRQTTDMQTLHRDATTTRPTPRILWPTPRPSASPFLSSRTRQ